VALVDGEQSESHFLGARVSTVSLSAKFLRRIFRLSVPNTPICESDSWNENCPNQSMTRIFERRRDKEERSEAQAVPIKCTLVGARSNSVVR